MHGTRIRHMPMAWAGAAFEAACLPVGAAARYGSTSSSARVAQQISMTVSLPAQYADLVAAGEIEPDAAQEEAVQKLSALEKELAEYRLARKSSSLGWLFGRRERTTQPV